MRLCFLQVRLSSLGGIKIPESEENFDVEGEFNLIPSPRVLVMLGEITLSQVNCLAEFIDNSVDSFLKAKRNNTPIILPHITIDLPSTNNTAARIIISNNGPDSRVKKHA